MIDKKEILQYFKTITCTHCQFSNECKIMFEKLKENKGITFNLCNVLLNEIEKW